MGDLYVGLISGTSMDGIDAVLIELDESTSAKRKFDLRHSHQYDYPVSLRERLQNIVRQPDRCTPDELGELDTWVGECFRDAALALLNAAGTDSDSVTAIGSHGQTVRHRPDVTHRFTTQIGNPSVIAAGTGIVTIADFRRADMALGGEGAPLTPPFHDWLFRDGEESRVVLNIGGIANITVLPSGNDPVTGFDTGPGNTLMDAWVQEQLQRPFDDAGKWAASGSVNQPMLTKLLADPWFAKKPPKSTGFEYFNLDWLSANVAEKCDAADVQATLSELTASSIADAVEQYAPDTSAMFVCGGGAHNPDLLRRIAKQLPNVHLKSTAAAGLEPDWIEAAAFAWLAKRRLDGQPGNAPEVTGASRFAVLGAIYSP